MQREHVANIIRTALCKSLSPEQASEIAAATVPVGVPSGGFVFRQGDKSEGLLIFVRGSVEILRQSGTAEPRVIAAVTAPTVLGEMGLVTERPRSATARATTACEFHLLTRREFARMLSTEQVAAYKLVVSVAEVVSRRLEAADDRLLQLAEAIPAPAEQPGAAPAPPPPQISDLTALREKLFSEWSF